MKKMVLFMWLALNMELHSPGATIVCGDSHTSTHGAFGAIAFGIGTSEVEMVLSTQCVMQPKPKKMRITINGSLEQRSYTKRCCFIYYFKIKYCWSYRLFC